MIDNNSIIGNNTKVFEESEITESTLGDNIFIDKYTRVVHSNLGNRVRLERNNKIVYSSMNDYCYTGANTTIINAKIGSFCSISWNVSIGGNTHDLNHITTHSFLVYPKWELGGNSNWKSAYEKCEIGNDVWIGSGANILRGVTIGDGAVIGASSVITKDVPPYAIMVGNPGRIIRMRARKEYIDRLETLKWWELPEDIIRDNFDLFKAELNSEILSQMEEIKEKFLSNRK